MLVRPKAFLHIGVEKTGTTTIQEFLYENKDMLYQQGVCFPALVTPRNHRLLAIYCAKTRRKNLYTRLKDIDNPLKRKKWKSDFRGLLEKEMNKVENGFNAVVFSSEHFSSLLKKYKEIKTLRDMILTFCSSAIIIVYIRRQDLMACSMIGNIAKAGHGKRLKVGGKIDSKHYFNYYKFINKWRKIFGSENIRLRVFEEKQLECNDLIIDFIQQAGIKPDARFKIPSRLNVSYSSAAIEAAWMFNEAVPSRFSENAPDVLRKLRLELIRRANDKYPGPGKMLDFNDAKAFLKKYEHSNQKLAMKWFGRKRLFSDDFSMYSGNEQTTNPDLIRKLVHDFIEEKGLQNKAK